MTSYAHLGTSVARGANAFRLKVFCADDDEDDRLFFYDALKDRSDLDVRICASGLELVKAVRNRGSAPALVFLDINMPGMNGFDVLERLSDLLKTGSVRIIMLTTGADPASTERCRNLGADYFIEKPSSFVELQKALLFGVSIDWTLFPHTKENFLYSRAPPSFLR